MNPAVGKPFLSFRERQHMKQGHGERIIGGHLPSHTSKKIDKDVSNQCDSHKVVAW